MDRDRICNYKGLTRREVLKYGLYGGLAVGLPMGLWLGGCAGNRDKIKPNVILISLDTLRADHLGCYGYKRSTSPAIDSLALQGILFEDVTAPAPWTLPSHASLLTGRYPSKNGVILQTNSLGEEIPTLAEVMRRHGFATSAIVNSLWLSTKNGLHRGFDDFAYVVEHGAQIKAAEITDKAVKWLSENGDKRFFLFLHYYDVHSDYIASPKYLKQYETPYKGFADGTTGQLLLHRRRLIEYSRADMEHMVNLYDAGILQTDDELLRLINVPFRDG
ncbi:hypothetical protein PITCH_A1700013 [uncultured Desulfobacterium sp.]|uniref:Sulfatase N-terminal domain-containing protein n=1 Tax=uncultured Desulfobacterium sp. TaxID=201089 RepID=A0A445MUF7_9BACT|nr:hypothetical protein PITCH_A1700013 [uncultured Desulfobacterium sp.]